MGGSKTITSSKWVAGVLVLGLLLGYVAGDVIGWPWDMTRDVRILKTVVIRCPDSDWYEDCGPNATYCFAEPSELEQFLDPREHDLGEYGCVARVGHTCTMTDKVTVKSDVSDEVGVLVRLNCEGGSGWLTEELVEVQ